MLKKMVCGAVIAGAFVFNVAAEDRVDQRSPETARPTAVQLSDAELDHITAGGVLAVIIFTPGNGSHTSNSGDRSIIITGLGRGGEPSHTIIKTP
jgi:hypothetical protein